VSRVPIRVRLTMAFALAMVLVLAGAALFVYLRLRADLEESINGALEARAEAVATLAQERIDARGPDTGEGADESFAQVLAPDGRLLTRAGAVARSVLTPDELARARRDAVTVERRIAPIDGVTRVLARPVSNQPRAPVVVVGQSLEDRDDALSGLVASFAVGGPLAVLLASLIGYGVATAGLAPIEAMRRRASEVSLSDESERLPLPAAHDEVRRLGETLNEMLERLRRSFERERRFVGDASHELRTPIAVVKAEVESALRAGGHDPPAREALVAAVEECDHLAQLAEDLLVVAHAADGHLPVRPEELGARALLESVRERFADRAAQHGREIRVEAPEDLRLRADPFRLRQALGNLVDNALRHGEGEVALGARAADGRVELEVSDEGPGFAPEFTERAFERLARGDGARTRGGAGLGLAIVRAVAEAHGGAAAIVPGPGATVRVTLPQP
jgi:two-component system, OmpR family, sensor kinase